MAERQKYLFVLQHNDERYDLMPFSIAKTWLDDKGLDIAIYLMYDAVQIAKKETIGAREDIKQAVDYLLSKGVPIFVCGFCTRACELNPESYYEGISVANRHIYYSLMQERAVINY